MRNSARLFLVLGAVIFLAACSLPRGAAMVSEIVNEKGSKTPTFQVVEVSRANVGQLAKWPMTGWRGFYRWLPSGRGPAGPIIRTGDRVDLVIWDSQENSLLITEQAKMVQMSGLVVSPSGTVFVPYLGEVVLRGMTPGAARARIQADLAPIAPDAQVQLSLTPGQDNSADLVSGVVKPGSYPLASRDVTVLGLIAQGGGISTSLRNPLVRLIRDGKTYEIRAEDLFENASKNALVRGNDKLLVEEDKRYFTALGATGSERLVYFEKEQITTMEAMAIIGGLSDNRANPKGVLVLRDYTPKSLRSDGRGPEMPQVVFTFDLTSADGLFAARNFPINPGDTVLATESPVNAARTIMGILGSAVGISNTLSGI